MNKKLLLVLVVIGAMLVSFSLVMGAKGPRVTNEAEPYVKPMVSNHIHAVKVHNYPAHQKGTAQTQPLGSTPGEITLGGQPHNIATCMLQPPAAYVINNWILGQELYANYEDPTVYGCTNIYPFQITQVRFWVGVPAALTFQGTFRLYTADLTNPSCPVPGVEFWNSGLLTWNLPSAGNWNLGFTIPASETLCVDTTYFVVMDIPGAYSPALNAVSSSVPLTCQSYQDIGSGWQDLVALYGWPGQIMLYSRGETAPNACAVPPPPDTSCNLQDDAGTAYLVYGNLVGDGYANYFDPSVAGCATPIYPFGIDTVTFELDDVIEPGYPVTWPLDVRVTVYDYISDICMGPMAPVHSEVFTIQQAEANALIKRGFSQPVCVYSPFFLGLFLESGTDFQPTFSQTFPNTADSCKAWAYWGGVWYNWGEVMAAFGIPIGYPVIRAHGITHRASCGPVPPIQCDTLQYTHGNPLNTITRPSSTYHRYYTNERFTAPLAGKVGKASVLFSARVGTPDAAILIWDDDGTGLPLNLIDSVYVPPTVPVNPNWCVVDFTSFNISFAANQEFHVGFTCPNYSAGPPQTNQLRLFADAGGYGSNRLSEWFNDFGFWGTFKDTYSGSPDYDAFINVEFCYDQPNFELNVVGATSQEIDWTQTTSYNVFLKSILGFNIPVTLTVTGFPPSAGTATFVPNPVVPSGPSVLNIVPVNSPAAAGEYVLTITGTAGAYTHQVTVKLKIDSPFNQEDVVHFTNGFQWVTNFGAVGNDAEHSFVWYNDSTVLFDGSFVIATTGSNHMALDIYNCHYNNWLASGPMNLYYDPTYNANVAYANFFTTENAISCEYDSVFIVGIMEPGVDFSIKIKVYYNPTTTPIVGMYPGLLEDWDVGDAYNDSGDMDPAHNLMYEFDPLAPNKVFGMMKAPFYDNPMYNMVFIPNPEYVWPNSGYCSNAGGFWGLDSLYYLVSTPGFFPALSPDTDFSMLMTAQPINLNPGDKHIEVWIDFGRDSDVDGLSWKQWWHRVLRYAGFYRGDVNASDSLEVPSLDVTDLVYLIQYLYQHGPTPKPYADQGDVNGDHKVDVLDIVYLINYVFNNGPAPRDYVRFIPQMWDRTSLFENPAWK